MKQTSFIFTAFLTLAAPTLGAQTCTPEHLEVTAQLTSSTAYASQVKALMESGLATNQAVDDLKATTLEQKKLGIADLKRLIQLCEQQAKVAATPNEAAHFLAVAYEAKLHMDLASPGSQRRNILADAVAALSSIDNHDETAVVVPFLARSATEEWGDYPATSHHLMERALTITERIYGKTSVERGEQVALFATLLAPREGNHNADPQRAEELFTEALLIFQEHPDAREEAPYRRVLENARAFSQAAGAGGSSKALAKLIE